MERVLMSEFLIKAYADWFGIPVAEIEGRLENTPVSDNPDSDSDS